jgi:Ca2+-binding EF-hand superfamily protein
LKKKWREADADSNDTLDIKELTQFTKNARLEMSCNEIAAVFLTLGRGFDERISFEEFYTWWRSDGAYGARGSSMSI